MPHIKRKSKETIDKRLVMAITITRQGVWMCEKKTKVTRRLAFIIHFDNSI